MSDLPEHITDASFAAHMEAAALIARALGQERAEMLDVARALAEAYADFFYDHLDQTDESDLNFLTRLAKEHDALATVKGQALLFIGKGEGKTASGLPMPPLPITRTASSPGR